MFDSYIIFRIKSTGEQICSYGADLETLLGEFNMSLEDVDIIPSSEWSAQQIAELISSEAENANYHDLTSVGENLLQELKEDGFSEEDQTRVLRALANVVGSMF